ncbi:MAG: serine/threonine-protein kinase [Polyangiaceae bacterium]|jgi:serine/threonine-protein kinase
MITQTQLQDDPQAARALDRVGVLLQDKWTLEALLGVGGMAAVYAATHRNGKRVAVKLLHAEFSHDEEIRTRFLREGYAANTIQHEGAVSVLDDDVASDGSAFLVMELLEGETVEQRSETSGGRLPVPEVLFIVDQLLDVLSAAHAKSVLHRDVKPENLFITRGGLLKVLDFGIAKVFERQQERTTSTRTGMVMGTPAFMAPEQARARWDEVDARTDLWAVGATMFALLTGRHVHEAKTNQEQLILSATDPAPALSSVAPEVPANVAAIVDRALAYDRANRWPDARTMQQAVRAALDADAPDGAVSGVIMGAERLRVRSGTRWDATGLASTSATGSAVSTWTRERDALQADVAKRRTNVGELQQGLADAKKRSNEAQASAAAARAERKSLEDWFNRRAGTRAASVNEARGDVRRHLVAIARRAMADRSAFGVEFDSSRQRVATLERAAESAARDVTVHELALRAYDPRAFRTGMVAGLVCAIIALALITAPVVWRAIRVVEPPAVHHAEPVH